MQLINLLETIPYTQMVEVYRWDGFINIKLFSGLKATFEECYIGFKQVNQCEVVSIGAYSNKLTIMLVTKNK